MVDGCGRIRWRRGGSIGRAQRIGEEGVENIGEQEFLVLLLVVHAEFDALQRVGSWFPLEPAIQNPVHQLLYATVDMLPEAQDLLQSGARKRGAKALFREGGEALDR